MPEIKEHNAVKVMSAPSYLVQYEDGKTGKTEVKLAFIVGDEVRFLADDSLSRPAQSWLKNDILVALGLKEEADRKPQVASTPTPVGLDEQI
jgi:hypothetical protein